MTTRLMNPAAKDGGAALGRCLGAVLLLLAAQTHADPVLTTHFSQATYDVDVRPGSELLGWNSNGIQITSYTTLAAITGTGVILEAFPGQSKVLRQTVKLHFDAHPGFTFTTVEFSHLLSYFVVEGSYSGSMSWLLDNGDGTPLAGDSGPITNAAWFNGGSWSDPTQPSPQLPVDADAFDLDVTLVYTAIGFPNGCSSTSGVCAQIGANSLKVWANTATAPDIDPPPPRNVPEPATWALLLAGLGLGSLRRRVPAS